MAKRSRRPVSAPSWVVCLLPLAVLAACERPADEETTGGDRLPAAQAVPSDQLLLAAARVALPPAGVAPSDLPAPDSPGAQLLVKYCSACHALPSPQMHSATDWPSVIRRMWLRTERVAGQYDVPVPTSGERITLLNYVLEHALQVSQSPLPGGPGRDLFVSTCSRCHELADPTQHSASDWPAVVIRMRQHMEDMLGETPAQREVQDIILYLERASMREM